MVLILVFAIYVREMVRCVLMYCILSYRIVSCQSEVVELSVLVGTRRIYTRALYM